MCFVTATATKINSAANPMADEKRPLSNSRHRRRTVRFATKAEFHLVTPINDMSREEIASAWYTKCELFAQQRAPMSPSECYSEDEKIRHVDVVLDAQDLLDEVGTTDVAAQARIMAAVASKSSEKSRQRATATASTIATTAA